MVAHAHDVVRYAAWSGADGGSGPAIRADFERLTGKPIATYGGFSPPPKAAMPPAPAAPIPAAASAAAGAPVGAAAGATAPTIEPIFAAAVDYDGSGKDDFLLVTPVGGLTLANRGFGAFLINPKLAFQLHAPDWPFRIGAGTLAAPGPGIIGKYPRQNLFILTVDGKLYELENVR
jgi:hypothetical protein